jgi:hypothetical protein
MAKTTDIVVSALAEWNGKALTKGQKDITSFDKGIKKLGKTFAAVFGAAALINYSKNAIKAFAADEKAAKALEVQLQNLGYGLSAPGVELYIASLQKMYGVLDDDLRPAFQSLITASGSLAQSQRALDVALNISAATGKSLEEVSSALAKGFQGQTKGIAGLAAGIDKATLASGDMNKILDELNAKFAGQAAARLDTYAGKMDALKVASSNASEIIGKSLIESLQALSGSTDIQTVTSQMEAFATEVGFAISEIAKLIGLLNTPIVAGKGILGILGELIFPGGNPFRQAAKIRDKDKKYPGGSGFTYDNSGSVAAAQARAAELKNLKEKNRVNAQLLAVDKAKLALSDLAKKFDVERLGLQAALNTATDEETKLRIKAQLALLDQDAALAKKYNAELEAAAGLNALNAATRGLTLQMGASISDIQKYLAASSVQVAQYQAMGAVPSAAPDAITASQVNAYLANKATEITADTQSYLEKLRTTVKDGYTVPSVTDFYGSLTGIANSQPQQNVNNNIYVTAQGSILALQDLDQAIQDAMLRIQRQNGTVNPAGYLP